jgi:hypothetical protein
MAKVKIPLTLTLSEAHFQKICDQVEGEGEDAQKFALYTQEAMEALAKGAMLLSPEVAARLSDIDPQLGDPDALVEAIERGMGVHEGQMVARWDIDPSLYESIRQRAEINGVTVEQLVQEGMDQAVALGWLWDLEARGRTWFFDREQYAQLCKLMEEKEVTVDMLLSRLAVPDLPQEPAAEGEKSELGQTEEQDELAFLEK